MTGSRDPHRRHSPAVYRRRRLVLLVAVLVVAGLVWLFIAQPWRGAADGEAAPKPAPTTTQDAATTLPVPDSEAGTTPTPTPTPTTPALSPSPSSTVPAVQPCTAGDLVVQPQPDQTSYAAGQKPKFSIVLTNTSDDDCTLNVGTSTQKFTVTSGSDTWWRSTDCQSKPSDQVVLLAAGQKVASAAPLEWDRTRSSTKTCGESKRPAAPGGGASYHLSVDIGGVSSDDTVQFLLY